MGGTVSYPEDVDLNGKIAIVTGGNTGIGYETAKAISFLGAHTIIACRSEERATQAIDRIKEEGQGVGKGTQVEFMKLDLSSLESTKNFIEDFKQKNLPLHMLICNAGIGVAQQAKTENNLEQHFQINHLGHFLMCLELLPCVMSTEGDKRIVLVSSMGHTDGVWDPNNLQGDVSYDRMKFYSNSKLYNVMTMYALQRRAKDCGITVSSLHPGMVKTEISRGFSDSFFYTLLYKVASFGIGVSAPQGAVTTINCAVNPTLNSQQAIYYSKCAPKQPSATARNEQYQEELWKISCELLKEWMSPEIWDKYGPSKQTDNDNDGQHADKDQPLATVNDAEMKP